MKKKLYQYLKTANKKKCRLPIKLNLIINKHYPCKIGYQKYR